MSQVNLLPPELRQRQAIRRTTSLVVVIGIGLLALVGVFYFLQTQRLAGVEDDLAAQTETNVQLQGQIAELQPFADLQAELAAKEALVSTLFLNEVSWSSALLDVSRVIPDASYLTNMTGQLATLTGGAVAAPAGEAADTTLIGTMSFAGVAGGTDTIATWLTRLEEVQGWVNAWVTTAQEDAPFSGIYSFTSGLDLAATAATERGQGGGQL
ncbi:MAG: PilN domain-containing protein [Actinomycetota bacterium]